MNPLSYAHLLLTKAPKNMIEKKQPLQQMLLGKVVISCRKLKPDPCLSPYTNTNSNGVRTLISDPKPCCYYRKEQGIPAGSNRYRQGLPQ
jgi:hypothetical protein